LRVPREILVPHDDEAKDEITKIPPGKRKAFFYDSGQDAIAVGNSIHAVLMEKLGSVGGCAGFLERTQENFIWIIHWPESPTDMGGKAMLPKVVKKLKTLGFNANVRRA